VIVVQYTQRYFVEDINTFNYSSTLVCLAVNSLVKFDVSLILSYRDVQKSEFCISVYYTVIRI